MKEQHKESLKHGAVIALLILGIIIEILILIHALGLDSFPEKRTIYPVTDIESKAGDDYE